jgi:hypothetical protein
VRDRAALDRKVDEISGLVGEIVKPIENGDYETKTRCCPTLCNLLRKYAG